VITGELSWQFEILFTGEIDVNYWLTKFITYAGVILGSLLLLIAIFALYRFYTYEKEEKEHQVKIEKFLEDYRNFKPTRYLYMDVKRITNQFTEKLGEGAYGTVFKGKLSNNLLMK